MSKKQTVSPIFTDMESRFTAVSNLKDKIMRSTRPVLALKMKLHGENLINIFIYLTSECVIISCRKGLLEQY